MSANPDDLLYYGGEGWETAVSIEYMAVVVVLRTVAISIGRAAAYCAMLSERASASIGRADGPWRWRGPIATQTCYLHAFLLL